MDCFLNQASYSANKNILMKLIDILTNKCPNCSKGEVFTNLYSLGIPKMNDLCKKCGINYTREPGFFWGAMYVSYALAVAESIVTFIISSFFFTELFDLKKIIVITIVLLLLAPLNMRFSRIIWLYLFKNS